ncbi:MAG: hypothetical protein KF760_10720 [Candidatus Eremiobacteraeota bacterium]|nr:hypothetical protein [Candidatus Eremiobacteraeota bacterium]MCW5870301.1 hypothetical protein [Candidatus Eremiobacteraeota bacterium]
MTVDEILARLEATFEQEGVRFEALGSQEHRLLVRAQRTGPGTPVAFLVKALEGTLRRYHEHLREVELVEYDPGEGNPTPEVPSQEFDKVLKHKAAPSKLNLPEVPGLDLRGCDRAQAVKALEQAHKIWSRHGVERFKIRGLKEDAVRKAVEKWRTFYEEAETTELESDGDTLRVVLKGARAGEFPAEEMLWFPARLMLMGS